jgi:predicted transcriptional regulator
MPTTDADGFGALTLTGKVVASFVGANSLPATELPNLIQSVHTALTALASGAAAPAAPAAPAPAVAVRKSITPDYLICLDDGLKFKSLRRHLATLGMTPEQYREKWSLPRDYPMVATNYAAVRSALAKKSGLGQMRKRKTALKSEGAGKGKRGRPRKTVA